MVGSVTVATVTDPTIYALGTLTTGISFTVIGLALAFYFTMRRRASGKKI